MASSILTKLDDWKQFERLCADLLEAEGYTIESEPFVDRKGTDIIASQEYTSYAGDTIKLRWKVQCKHYAGSGKNLGRKEMDECLFNYEANRQRGDGLLLIIDTDYSEIAKETVDSYLANHHDARINLWNQRQLSTRLERHPYIVFKYGLSSVRVDYHSVLSSLNRFGAVSTLLISDQSALAHNLTSVLRNIGFDVTFLSFWNYQDIIRTHLALQTFPAQFKLIIIFLGDSFGLPLPGSILDIICRGHNNGTPLLFFPFVAWSINRGYYRSLVDIVPVKLLDPITAWEFDIRQIVGDYRRGDYRWLLKSDSFAEDQYSEIDPLDGYSPFVDGVESRFGLSHSFEYLESMKDAKVMWKDTVGNPIVVVRESKVGKVCYLNTCCHSCMTTIPVLSPLEVSHHFGVLLRNVISWLLE